MQGTTGDAHALSELNLNLVKRLCGLIVEVLTDVHNLSKHSRHLQNFRSYD